MEVRAGDPLTLARLAWHLGNRHLPTELAAQGAGALLRLRPDPVIAAMLRGLGAEVVETRAPFQPEGGAYGGQGGHHHHRHDDDHGHDDGHGHDHDG